MPKSLSLRDGSVFIVSTVNGLQIEDIAARKAIKLGDKPTVLLVLLVASGEAGLSRRSARDLLWESSSPANASNSLRQAVFRLRRALGQEAIEDVGGRLRLRVPVRVDLFDIEASLDLGAVADALERLTAPIGGVLDLGGSALRGWTLDLRQRIERRLVDGVARLWEAMRAGPAPERIDPVLARAQSLLRHREELHWVALDVAATLGQPHLFERHVEALWSGRAGQVTLAAGTALTTRIATLREQLARTVRAQAGAALPTIHEDAMGRLDRHWTQARTGAGSLVFVTGARGAGRSWLLREFARRVLTSGSRVAQVTAEPNAARVPGASLHDITVALKGFRGAAGIQPAYTATIARLLEGTLTVPADAEAAVYDLLGTVADEGAVLVTLDDAERYEPRALMPLLRRLRQRGTPNLLVVVALADEPGAWRPPADTPQIQLAPSDAAGLRILLGAMARLPQAEWVEPLLSALHQTSGGSPGTATALVVCLHDAGHLRIADDRWILGSPLETTLSALRGAAAA